MSEPFSAGEVGRLSSGPYRGPYSYGHLDRELFFGREADAERVVSRILSGRNTLLYAPSGAGKTSLLRARAVPWLTRRGIVPAIVRPGSMTDQALSDEIWAWLVPSPAREARQLRFAASWLGAEPSTPVADLGRMLRDDPDKQLEIHELGDGLGAGPLSFCFRTVLSDFPLGGLDLQLKPMLVNADPDARIGSASIETVLSSLEDPAATELYASTREEFERAASDLPSAIAAYLEVWGARVAHVDVVVVLDQFEEVFTHGHGLAAVQACPGWSASSPDQRLRYVVSMRDDYVGRALPELPLEGPGLSRVVRLNLMDRDQAIQVVMEPFMRFGVAIEESAAEHLTSHMTGERAGIPPAALSIVCQRLWEMISVEKSATDPTLRIEDERALTELLGLSPGEDIAHRILIDHIEELLLSTTDEDGVATGRPTVATAVLMHLISALITEENTRRTVPAAELKRIMVGEAWLDDLLNDLKEARIATTFTRRDTEFIEVTHEFLIGPLIECTERLGKTPVFRPWRDSIAILERMFARLDDEGGTTGVGVAEYHHLKRVLDAEVGTRDFTFLMVGAALEHGSEEEVHRVVDTCLALGDDVGAVSISSPRAGGRGVQRQAWELADGDPDVLLQIASADAVLEAAIKWSEASDSRAIVAAIDALEEPTS